MKLIKSPFQYKLAVTAGKTIEYYSAAQSRWFVKQQSWSVGFPQKPIIVRYIKLGFMRIK